MPSKSKSNNELNAQTGLEYESMFKINGEPILPPLLTPAKLHEARLIKANVAEKLLQRVKRSAQERRHHSITAPVYFDLSTENLIAHNRILEFRQGNEYTGVDDSSDGGSPLPPPVFHWSIRPNSFDLVSECVVSVTDSIESQKQEACQVHSVELGKQREEARREAAASVINAYTRGHLLRRLCRTEKVRLMKNAILDTLVVMLDVHVEAKENKDPGNMRLQARLLQQLNTAKREFRRLLVESTPADRLNVLAEDRQWQMNKLKRKSQNYLKATKPTQLHPTIEIRINKA